MNTYDVIVIVRRETKDCLSYLLYSAGFRKELSANSPHIHIKEYVWLKLGELLTLCAEFAMAMCQGIYFFTGLDFV